MMQPLCFCLLALVLTPSSAPPVRVGPYVMSVRSWHLVSELVGTWRTVAPPDTGAGPGDGDVLVIAWEPFAQALRPHLGERHVLSAGPGLNVSAVTVVVSNSVHWRDILHWRSRLAADVLWFLGTERAVWYALDEGPRPLVLAANVTTAVRLLGAALRALPHFALRA